MSLVMQTCTATSSGTSVRECLYATRLRNGMMMFRPGSSTWWNFPRRSTTQAFCCGTTRTPSITNTVTSATMANGIVNARSGSKLAMRKVAMMTPTSLTSMLPPRFREISSAACARSGGPGLGNFECVAIDSGDIENFSGLGGDASGEVRVPARVAVFHARVTCALVDPGFEGGGLPHVDPPHGARTDPLLVVMHPDDAGDGHRCGGEGLPNVRAAGVADGRSDQRGDAQDEQVERARHQLCDDEGDARDQPGQGNVHRAKPELGKAYANPRIAGAAASTRPTNGARSPGRPEASGPGGPRWSSGPARRPPRRGSSR